MNFKRDIITLLAIVIILTVGIIYALKVAPGSFTMQNVPLGQRQDMGVSFVCTAENTDYVFAHILLAFVDMPECDGYRPIPDVSWFIMESGETLYVDSSGIARSKMFTNIPDRPELYNQHFSVRVFVIADDNGIFQPAIVPYYFIETPPLANPPVPPDGELGIAPSVIEMNLNNSTGSFIIFNNDSISHSYEIIVRTPVLNSRKLPDLSPGFSTVLDTSRFNISPAKVKLKPNSRKKISLRWLNIAEEKSLSEALIFITADNGIKNFIRVKLTIDEK